jgi:hypothetical protein
MQLASSYPGWQRWVMPVLLSIIVPLLFAALPGEPLQILARDAGLVKQARTDIAMLHAVRTGFQQVRETERDILSGRSAEAQKLAISGIRRALNRMTGKSGPEAENVAALQDAIEGYARTLTHETAVRRYDEPPMQPLLVSAASNAIESVLGQLQTRDAARLQEPLLAMRLAEANLRSEQEPRSAEQVSRSAVIFAARLDEMAIPPGTRTRLLARLAAYQHAVFSTDDALLLRPTGRNGPQAAARAVDTALANADYAMTAAQQRLNETFQTAGNRFVWSYGAALAAALLIIGGGLFGRMALDHGLARTWHAR